MKKQVALLLSVCATLSAISMLTACGGGHEHSYETTWSKDETHHWHACEGNDCNEVSEETEHTWDEGVATENVGEKLYTCTVCEQTKTQAVRTTITEEEWNVLLLFNNFTFSNSRFETKDDQDTAVYLVTEEAVFIEQDDPDGDYYAGWAIKKGDGWHVFETFEKNGEFGERTEELDIDDFNLFHCIYHLASSSTTYNNYTYDETQKAYVYNNTTLYIEDGKLVKLEVDANFFFTCRMIFSDYGTTVANPPENLK